MRFSLLLVLMLLPVAAPPQNAPAGAAADERPRVMVSTDIGGTDPDDLQSMVHFLLYADMFDVEGIVSSPYGPGRREHILQVIEHYERDYANLKTHSPRYPTPAALRAISWQGAIESAGAAGFDRPTEGSRRIIAAARRRDPRPLYLLVWGGIDDLAQALHDAPDILPKLRVYFIGGPNKMWSVNAYNYIEQHHPRLWIIEANATYRGWFTGGNQSGEWGNTAFVTEHLAGRGALGDFFATLLRGTVKMGDSPSVVYPLHRAPEDPSQPGWGGRFVRIWDGRKTIFDRLTTASDTAEAFGMVEFALRVPAGMTARNSAQMIFDGRIPAPATNDGRVLRFRFSPRDAKVWPYVIKSDVPGLDGQSGQFTAAPPPPERFSRPSSRHPHWWIDDPDPAAAEGVHPGAKSVSRWREEFLRDFAARMARTKAPLSPQPASSAPWENGRLQVSANGRYLQHANGRPFFWQGDTAWLLFQKMDRDEVKTYFEDRRAKQFNVVQCIALQSLAHVNAYGDTAFVGDDITRPATTPGSDPAVAGQYDFWDHVDYIADTAARNGIYLAITPTWGHFVRTTPISSETAATFARQLAERFKNRPNIIWINGGSVTGDVKPEIWETIGKTIKQHAPAHLMTFHPFGRTQSSTWFNGASWLDFNMFTSGHRRYDQDDTARRFGEDNWRYVLDDLGRTPRKPTIDGEPSYEDTPQGLHDLTQPYWSADDVRRYAYWSVFAGALGHTYGHNSVRQVYKEGETRPASGAKQYFAQALAAPGASQMQFVRRLVLSRPYFDRVNDQSLVSGDESEQYDRVLVARGRDYLLAYVYTGRTFTVQMGRISGSEVTAWWYNPRTGEAALSGTHKNTGVVSFDPPGERNNGNDWVLVLDDASKNFAAPGRSMLLQ